MLVVGGSPCKANCSGHLRRTSAWDMRSIRGEKEFHQHQRVTKNFLSYYVLAMPFSMIAFAGLFTVAWASVEGLLPWKVAWGILLAGTVPHMILLDHCYQSNHQVQIDPELSLK